MSERIEELRKAYDAASDDLAAADAKAAAADAAYYCARIAANAAKRQWREAKAALEAAERETEND